MELKKYKRATIALGTIVEFTLWLKDGEDLQNAFNIGYEAIREIDRKMSLYDNKSDIGRFRLAKKGEMIQIDSKTAEVLNFAEALSSETEGYFDVCVVDTLIKHNYLPKSLNVKNRRLPKPRQPLLIYQENGQHFLNKTTDFQIIDLGGIAKGYAVDYAIDTLKKNGISAGLVNAGGDMRIFGHLAEPIHLRLKEGTYIPLCILKNQAIATSAYPSNRKDGSKEYLPIVNPFTQKCIKHNKRTISVISDKAMVADALTKLAWLDKLDISILNRYNSKLIHNH